MRVLSINQGCGGGIGRAEVLLERGLRKLETPGRLEAYTLRKLEPPNYLAQSLNGQSWSAAGNRRRLITLGLRWFMKNKPDVVVFSHMNLSPLGLLMRVCRPSTRIAVLVHGIEAWHRPSALRRLALRSADAVWSGSAYTQNLLLRHVRLDRERTSLLPWALLPEQFNRLRTEVPAASPRRHSILSVSRLDASERSKGIDHVLDALPHVAQHVSDVSYMVVGSGSDQERLVVRAQRLGIADRVTFYGSVNDDDLAQAYEKCDLFALPSSKEGFGLVFLEAMAASKAVVAAAAGGSPEVVLHGNTGVLVPVGDRVALAEAIVTLLQDDARRVAMGEAGRQRVTEYFTFETYVDRLKTLLCRLVPGFSSRPDSTWKK